MKEKTNHREPKSTGSSRAKLQLISNNDEIFSRAQWRPTSLPTATRQQHLKTEIGRHVFAANSPIAAAAAFVSADGEIELSIIGVEPELASDLADGLDRLADRLRAHERRTRRNGRQDGRIFLPALAALPFAALTYINDIAWLDAVLIIAAQIASAWLSDIDPPS